MMNPLPCLLATWSVSFAGATPLDDYVNAPDDTYRYEDLGDPYIGDGFRSHFINLTSQTWLTPRDVDRSVWWHYLVINIPDVIEFPDKAFIYVTGGSNTDGRPSVTSEDLLLTNTMAFSTNTVTATLFQIPNERIVFSSDPLKKSRSEDAIIAFTWQHFLFDTTKPEWLLRLPMTKAVVRAMDTVTDFMKKENSSVNIDKFVVCGASKRGWTTWTTAIVDKRVIGIIPIVMDLLNLQKNVHHQYRNFGGWTFAFKDYYDLNLTAYFDDPSMSQMASIVDPYAYKERLVMPKLMVCTGGDEFFQNDDSWYFWDDLPGEKFIRTLPNAEHSCAGHFTSLLWDARAFYLSLLLDTPRPKMTWTMNQTADGGFITMTTNTKPTQVLLYHATTLDDKRKDFRLLVGPADHPTPHPVLWTFKEVIPTSESPGMYVYVGKETNPSGNRWKAFFLQVAFSGPRNSVFEFTTQVNIVPNTFPFPDCEGAECRGVLV